MGIISPLHFDSKSMHFEVIIGSFFFSFIFPIAAFEKHLTDLWGGGATEQPWFCSMGGTFCSAHGDMGELTPWDMLLGCSFL